MNRLLLLLPLALLAACHADTKTDTTTTAPPEAPATVSDPAAPADSPGASYRIYRGLLPGTTDSLTLHLVRSPNSGDTELNGTYASYADASGQPFQLVRRLSAADSLVFEDISYEHLGENHSGPMWQLYQQGPLLTGTIAGQPVRLRQAQPAGSVALRVRQFNDSVAAYPGKANSPHAHLSLQVLLPAQAPAALTANILRDLHGDTLANQPVVQPEQQWQQWNQHFTKDYREDAASLQGEETPAYALRHESQQAAYVLWNQASLLSLGLYNYSFTGGAHGSYGTIVATYNTRTGQRLRFADVFRPAAETQLSPILDRAVRRTLRIPATEALDQTLFVKQMPVTHNFYLTSGGAVFVYTPYEIASYAQGEIHVFVPMKELQSVLLPPTNS
ncbi:DUF3298 domain-containing protein [Hymenobacter sp. ASUV-10]|uniref:DUF3298 domain-containing protein n=1 Tax=Hymenobacter aranciens TaxID=3063996 RepID=A0ABT9BFB8_9BACT|nr:DUF3298 and DUF4163 domain-containing protein [Hymenobacter sp. ASUV-10]MDO7876966.1 DUF3298 domain-containing protein [Hymenobacter sp. ASUV-10]